MNSGKQQSFSANKINTSTSAIDVKKLDDETEFILDKFREGYQTIELKQLIKNFVEINITQFQVLIEQKEYKNCYFVLKKLEKVISVSLKGFGAELENNLICFKEMLTNFLDTQRLLQASEKTQILKHIIELSKNQFRNKEDQNTTHNSQINQSNSYDFFKFLTKYLVSVLNNIGIIYILRNKIQEGLTYFVRALLGRIQDIDSHIALYQSAILETNISFVFKLLGQFDEAGHYLNKAILVLEWLDKTSQQQKAHVIEICLNFKLMMSLLELLYNKREKKLLPDPREIQRERMLHILAIAYHYYSELLQQINKQIINILKHIYQECRKVNFETFYKLNPRAGKIIMQTPEMAKLTQDELLLQKQQLKNNFMESQPNQNKLNENFSSVSFKTVQTNSSLPSGNIISKEKIVFQKYMLDFCYQFFREISKQRFKVIILYLSNLGCIQILLYSKPMNFLKKVVLPYSDLVEYSKKYQADAFSNEKTLEMFFKSIIKKLYIKDDELHIKDLEHFQSLEEYQQLMNISPTNLQDE